ncbi:LOW QUALITY PROTEIN: hypothetical protein PHMEG_00035659, partial [Phytophthora megakarya]
MTETVTAKMASQIDTTVQLSQRTIQNLFGTSSESEAELSQTAVARAFDMPQDGLLLDESQMEEAAAGLQLLSGASGVESDEEEVTNRTPNLPKEEKDVNFVPDTENASLYESFGSDESDSVAVEEDLENPSRSENEVDEDVISDSDAVQMDKAFIDSLQLGGRTSDRSANRKREDALRAMEWTEVSSVYEADMEAFPRLGTDEARPVSELRKLCHSPILTFFYFMPKSLWVNINHETNLYGLQQVDRRAQAIQARQAKKADRRMDTLKNIRRRLKAKAAYQPHEILHVVGLLVARMLCPQKSFAAHWSMVEDGAIPAGNFGRFMSRNRCQDILRDLHFVDNQGERNRDKMWKLRPVITKVQQRFLEGWTLPAVFSFDEGVLPATSKIPECLCQINLTGQRTVTGKFVNVVTYSIFEMYAGKRNMENTDTSFDHKTGAAAVVRNLKLVLGERDRKRWHAVVVDRYYSSVLLAIELLNMKVYVVGTIMVNRLGLDKRLK